LHAWRDCFTDQPTTCRDAWEYADKGAGLDDLCDALQVSFEMLREPGKPFDDKNLARWVAAHRDEVVDGLRFEGRKTRDNKNAWRVVGV
jgi:hypothetical protein